MSSYYQYILFTLLLCLPNIYPAMENGMYLTFAGGIGLLQRAPKKANALFADLQKTHVPDRALIDQFSKCFSSIENLKKSQKIFNIGLGFQLSPNIVLEGYPLFYQAQGLSHYFSRWHFCLAGAGKLIVPLPLLEGVRIYGKRGKVLILHIVSNLTDLFQESSPQYSLSPAALYDQLLHSEKSYWFWATGIRIELSSTKTLDISWERHPFIKDKVAHFIKIGLDWHL